MPKPIVVEHHVKTSSAEDAPTVRQHLYWCPGCDMLHGVTIRPDVNHLGAGWEFSGTLEAPTYSPSQLTVHGGTVCHTYIRNGQIEFLADCTHHLRGKTVPLPPLPSWMIDSDGD